MDWMAVAGAVALAPVFILVMSWIPEPARQGFNATFVAGAGGAYLAGGAGPFGMAELGFATVVAWLAYRGFRDYRFIGVAWLTHTVWDVAHHLAEAPILELDPSSSLGCAVFDALIAVWFIAGAPSPLRRAGTASQRRNPIAGPPGGL